MTSPPSRSRTSSSGCGVRPAPRSTMRSPPIRRSAAATAGGSSVATRRVAQQHGDASILDGTLVEVIGQGRIVGGRSKGAPATRMAVRTSLSPLPVTTAQRRLAVRRRSFARRPGASPARPATPAGSPKTPARRPASRIASRIASSGTATKAPPDSRTARSALRQLRGWPDADAVGDRLARPRATTSPPASNASTSGRAPAPARRACAAARDEAERVHLRAVPSRSRRSCSRPPPTPPPSPGTSAPICSPISRPQVFLPSTSDGFTAALRLYQPYRVAGALAQLPGLVVAAAHADHARAEHQELRHLGLGRELGHEDAPRAGRALAAAPASDEAALPVEAQATTSRVRAAARATPDPARAVLERGGGVAPLVLQAQQRAQARPVGQARGLRRSASSPPCSGRPPRALRARAAARGSATCPSGRDREGAAGRARGAPREVELDVEHAFRAAARAGAVQPRALAPCAAHADEAGHRRRGHGAPPLVAPMLHTAPLTTRSEAP